MATKTNNISFQQVMASLKNGQYAPVYVLMGDEPYYIDLISDFITNNALSPDQKDFNQTVVFGSDTTAAAVADMCRRFPMMAERQVVIVKEAQNIRNLDALVTYLQKPVKSTVLVWCHKHGKIDGRGKFLSLAAACGVVFESKRVREYELPSFISSYLKKKKVSIDPKAAQMIAEHVGSDLSRIVTELDKLVLSLGGDKNNVSPELVESEIGVSKDFNVFELKSAIVNKDVFKANQIAKYFDNNPKAGSLFNFLPIFFNFFQNLMIAYYAPKKQSGRDIAEFLNLKNEWAAKDYLIGLKNYSGKKTLEIIHKLREIDAKSKGINNPNTPPGELMQELIYFILH